MSVSVSFTQNADGGWIACVRDGENSFCGEAAGSIQDAAAELIRYIATEMWNLRDSLARL